MNMWEENKKMLANKNIGAAFVSAMNIDKDGEIGPDDLPAHRTQSPIPGSNHRAVRRPITARDLQTVLSELEMLQIRVRNLMLMIEL